MKVQIQEFLDILWECLKDMLHEWYIWLPFIVFIGLLGYYLGGR